MAMAVRRWPAFLIALVADDCAAGAVPAATVPAAAVASRRVVPRRRSSGCTAPAKGRAPPITISRPK